MLIYLLLIFIAGGFLGGTTANEAKSVFEPWTGDISAVQASEETSGSRRIPRKLPGVLPGAFPGAGGIRGMTITCFGSGPGEWDSPQMGRTLDELAALGVTWIAFHPYAWIGNQGQLQFNTSVQQSSVMVPLREAAKRGLKVMLKPHLGYWGSRFSWRGAIHFNHESQWRRFFSDYEKFIVTQATMAEAGHAALFCIGVEYKKTIHREANWRQIIRAVRRVYHGKLTYGANWDNYQKVHFWDALDYIGIQAYFPLSKARNPTPTQLIAGWDRVLTNLRTFAKKHQRQVLFTELGYSQSSLAASKPWATGSPDALGATLKLRCMEVALSRLQQEQNLAGVFLWKWFPSVRSMASDFTLQYPAMRQILAGQWRTPSAHKKTMRRSLKKNE